MHTAVTRSPISSHDDGSASASSRFPPVSLSRARLDAFHSDAHKALAQTLAEFTQLDHTGVDSQRWKYMRSRGGISVYLDRQQEVNTQNSLLLAAGTVKARMADVMEGLYMDTSEDTRLVQHRIHTRFVDAEVLKVVERRSPEHPYNFTGLKWALLKTSSTGIVSNRDLCFLEKIGTIDIAGGRKLGYFIMQSVNLRECPPSSSSKVVRAHVSLCYLFEETKNGMLGVYMTGSMISFGPKMLWKFARNNFADIVISIGRASRLARAKRYARLLRSKHERQGFRSQRPAGECELCHSPASFFERHRECMGCHKVSVCKKCRSKQDIFLREDHVSLNLARATFCNECIQSVHNPDPPRSPVFAPQHSMISTTAQRTQGASNYKPARIFKQESFASTNPSTTSSSISGSGYEDLDLDRDSERSLRMFDIRMRQEFEDAGFDETDEVSRLTVLAVLGTGERVRDSVNDRESGATSTSFASSCSFDDRDDDGEVDADADDQDDDDREDELVQSVILVQRSLQPPEMLERQKLRRDGSLRPQARSLPNVAEDEDATRALFSRLQQVSKLAEQTHEFTKQQTWRAEELFSTPPRPQANHRTRQPAYHS